MAFAEAAVVFVVRGVASGVSLDPGNTHPFSVPKASQWQACDIRETAVLPEWKLVSSIFTIIGVIACKTYLCSFKSPKIQQRALY